MAACPLVSPVDVLDDMQRLKAPMDGCLMRVFEGIEHRRREQKLYRNTGVPAGLFRTRQEEPDEGDGEDDDEGLTTRTRGRALSEPDERRGPRARLVCSRTVNYHVQVSVKTCGAWHCIKLGS